MEERLAEVIARLPVDHPDYVTGGWRVAIYHPLTGQRIEVPVEVSLINELYLERDYTIPHPLEAVIWRMRSEPLRVITQLGIVPPPNTAELYRYLVNNIVYYRDIPVRSNLTLPRLFEPTPRAFWIVIDQLTDQEIISYAGLYLPYESRDDLIATYLIWYREMQSTA